MALPWIVVVSSNRCSMANVWLHLFPFTPCTGKSLIQMSVTPLAAHAARGRSKDASDNKDEDYQCWEWEWVLSILMGFHNGELEPLWSRAYTYAPARAFL